MIKFLLLRFFKTFYFRQGEESNVAYIILNGRLRSVVKNTEGKKELADEYGRGETVGVVSQATDQSNHSSHMYVFRLK